MIKRILIWIGIVIVVLIVADQIGISVGGLFALLPPLLFLVAWILLIVIHVMVGIGLSKDVQRRHNAQLGTYLGLGPYLWMSVGLVFGLLGLLAYWFFNDLILSRGWCIQGNRVEPNPPAQD